MIDWKKLAQNGDYEEILRHASEAISASDLFLVVSAYLAKGRGKEAMDTLLSKRDLLFEANPALLLKANFETRFALRQFDEAYEDLAYFASLPYVSQAIEEQLRDLPHRIRVEEIASGGKKAIDEEEMHELLAKERDPATLLAYLNSLKKVDLMPYFGDLHALLASEDVHDDVKSYALMLCAAHHDEVTVSFEKGGRRFTLIPAEVKMPYSLPFYQGVRHLLSAMKDPSVGEIAGELLDAYVLAIYPTTYASDLSPQEEAAAFACLAKRYLGAKADEEGPIASRIEALLGVLEKTCRA